MAKGRFTERGVAVSCALHAVVLAALIGSWRVTPVKIAQRLPGEANGTRLTLEYKPGGAPPAVATAIHAPLPIPRPTPTAPAKPSATPVASSASEAAPGAGLNGESSLGDGNISIALVKTHPRPAPDLSGLPHGTAGDVVLDVVIDAQGRIAEAKIERGLGAPVDDLVLATVREQWTFAPATRNGVAIASEQELLFHYERG